MLPEIICGQYFIRVIKERAFFSGPWNWRRNMTASCGNWTCRIFSQYKGVHWGQDSVSPLCLFSPEFCQTQCMSNYKCEAHVDLGGICPTVLTWQTPYTFPTLMDTSGEGVGHSPSRQSPSFSQIHLHHIKFVLIVSEMLLDWPWHFTSLA